MRFDCSHRNYGLVTIIDQATIHKAEAGCKHRQRHSSQDGARCCITRCDAWEGISSGTRLADLGTHMSRIQPPAVCPAEVLNMRPSKMQGGEAYSKEPGVVAHKGGCRGSQGAVEQDWHPTHPHLLH